MVSFERALEAILARVVISAGDSIAVAYSGGLDSSVLLQLAVDFCRERNLSLRAFHVHHGLSMHADQWLAHAQQRCTELGIPFEARKASVTGKSEHGVEQAARLARYAALSEMCEQGSVKLLLTAHHQDDQAETMMLQWLRGAGLPGLSGMAALQTEHPLLPVGVALGRPLLELARSDLEMLASELQITHITDESNADVRYRRNALRNEIFPLIERHFEGFSQTLSRTSRHVQAAQRLLDELACSDAGHCSQGEVLLLDRLVQLSPDRRDNLVRYWLRQRTGFYPTEAQLLELQRQMLHSNTDVHPFIDLDSWRIERQRDRLLVQPIGLIEQPPTAELQLTWRGEAALEVPEWRGRLIFDEKGGPGIPRESLLASSLTLRARSGGERIKPGPGRPSRSLKNLFQESAVPARVRPWLPLVYLGDQLLYAAGLSMDNRFVSSDPGVCFRWEPSGATLSS